MAPVPPGETPRKINLIADFVLLPATLTILVMAGWQVTPALTLWVGLGNQGQPQART